MIVAKKNSFCGFLSIDHMHMVLMATYDSRIVVMSYKLAGDNQDVRNGLLILFLVDILCTYICTPFYSIIYPQGQGRSSAGKDGCGYDKGLLRYGRGAGKVQAGAL